MSGSLIVFSGIDGAGKSTQIERLATAWRQQGRPIRVVWSRGGYTPGMRWLKGIARKLLSSRQMPPAGDSPQRNRALARPLVRRGWLILAMLDLLVLYAIWLPLQKRLGITVICDRYLEDTALDFQLNFPQETTTHWWLWRCVMRCCPTPDTAFLLLVPIEEARRRGHEKQEPFPDSEQRLAMRLARYQQLVAGDPSWHVVDCQQPIADVAAQIQQLAEPNTSSPQVSCAR